MKRYFKLFNKILRYRYMGEMSFNVNFIANVLLHITWTVIPVLFYGIIYSKTSIIAGWSYEEVLLLVGTFQIFEGINQLTYFGGVFMYLSSAIHNGELDFTLLKPVNSQFLVSFKSPDIFGLTDLCMGLALCIWTVVQLDLRLTFVKVVMYILLVFVGVIINYSIFFFMSLSAFFTIKGSDLLFVLDSAIDESIMKPTAIYGKYARFLFMYVVPIFMMVSLPVKTLIEKIDVFDCIWATFMAFLLLFICNVVWKKILTKYNSASS